MGFDLICERKEVVPHPSYDTVGNQFEVFDQHPIQLSSRVAYVERAAQREENPLEIDTGMSCAKVGSNLDGVECYEVETCSC